MLEAVKQLEKNSLEKRILKGNLCTLFPSPTFRQYLHGDEDKQDVGRGGGMNGFNQAVHNGDEMRRSIKGEFWTDKGGEN